jgi:uncharacterized DUF497 family protein
LKPVGFDWDDEKEHANLTKHGVSFDEAMTAFDDDHAAIRDDPDHSIGEEREIIIGRSGAGRILLDVIRLISARQVTARERNLYEEILRKEI